MIFLRYFVPVGMLLSVATWAQAGVRFDFQGGERSGAGRPFNFGVSTTSQAPAGAWTVQGFSGKSSASRHPGLVVRQAVQVAYHDRGSFDTFRAATPSLRSRRINGEGQGGGVNAGGSFPDGDGGFGASAVTEQTSAASPVNTRYCYCAGNPGGGDDDDGGGQPGGGDDDGGQPGGGDDDGGQPGGGDDDGGQPGGGDDDDGQPGGGDDDDGQPGGGDDDDGGGDGPDPSVVPEPGSFALWVLASVLLIGVTRRQAND